MSHVAETPWVQGLIKSNGVSADLWLNVHVLVYADDTGHGVGCLTPGDQHEHFCHPL